MAAGAETGAGAAPGATAAGACVGAGAASGAAAAHSTDSLGMLLTTGTQQNVDTTPKYWCRVVCGMVCTCKTDGSGHVLMR